VKPEVFLIGSMRWQDVFRTTVLRITQMVRYTQDRPVNSEKHRNALCRTVLRITKLVIRRTVLHITQ